MSRAPLALAVLVVLAWPSAPASAGTYDVWSCAGPTGAPLPATGWSPQSYGGQISSTCGQKFGALTGSLPAHDVGSGAFARWTFEAPVNTTIANVTVQRTAGASSNGAWYRSYFLFQDSPVTMEGYGLDVCVWLTGPCQRPGDASNPLAEASRYTSGSIRAGRLIASAQCDGQSCAAQAAAVAGSFQIYRARIGLSDAFPLRFARRRQGRCSTHRRQSPASAPCSSTQRTSVGVYARARSWSTALLSRAPTSVPAGHAESRTTFPFLARCQPTERSALIPLQSRTAGGACRSRLSMPPAIAPCPIPSPSQCTTTSIRTARP